MARKKVVHAAPVADAGPRWPLPWILRALAFLVIEAILKYAAYIYRLEREILNLSPVLILDITYVENRNSAFGMMQHVPVWVKETLMAVAVAMVFVAIAYCTFKETHVWVRRGVCIISTGSFGNFIDRGTVGAVVDYIDIKLGPDGTWSYLAWNFSDIVINIGCVSILYGVYLMEKEEAKQLADSKLAEKNE